MLTKIRTYFQSIPIAAWLLLLMTVFSFAVFNYKNTLQTASYQGLLPLEERVRGTQYYLSKAFLQLERHIADDQEKALELFSSCIQEAEKKAREGLESAWRERDSLRGPGDRPSTAIVPLFIKLQTNLQLFQAMANQQIKDPKALGVILNREQHRLYLETDQTLNDIADMLRRRRERMNRRRRTIEGSLSMGWIFFSTGMVLFAIRIEQRESGYQRKLRLNEARLRSLFEALPDPVFVVDGDGIIQDAPSPNPTLSPSRPEDLIGQQIACLVGGDTVENAITHIRKALAEKTMVTFNYTQSTDDGDTYFEGRLIAIPEAETPRVLWVAHDLTGIRASQEHRLELERRIQENMRQESLGRMAEGVAHDFDNLLTGVMGHAEMALLQVDEASPLRESLKEIHAAAAKAAEVATQMLKYSGNRHMAAEAVDVNQLVRDIETDFKAKLPKMIDLTTVCARKVPLFEGDVEQIRQVIRNVTQNAVDAIADQVGGISIYTGSRAFTEKDLKDNYFKEDCPAGEYVFIRVDDTGHGIGHDDYGRLFDPFFTTKFTGRGLGLAVTQGIVRGHRGVIRVKSESGNGTSFEILFPCEKQGSSSQATDFSGVLSVTG
ncbi:MAG: ATP-binding protein [Lentisphaeria bacterium]|nr:ATP-binding protein [Lentisphaeria bacterium]